VSANEFTEARELVAVWLDRETTEYADGKWTERAQNAERLMAEGLMPGTWWRDFIDQYLHRAAVLGLDTAVGRQALLKACQTIKECCVAMAVELDGDLPAPGYPSGEVASWTR